MEIVTYNASYEDQLLELINSHLIKLPPFIEITLDEMKRILDHPFHMIDLYYSPFQRDIHTIVAIEAGKLVGAAQFTLPKDKSDALVNFLITRTGSQESDAIYRI